MASTGLVDLLTVLRRLHLGMLMRRRLVSRIKVLHLEQAVLVIAQLVLFWVPHVLQMPFLGIVPIRLLVFRRAHIILTSQLPLGRLRLR